MSVRPRELSFLICMAVPWKPSFTGLVFIWPDTELSLNHICWGGDNSWNQQEVDQKIMKHWEWDVQRDLWKTLTYFWESRRAHACATAGLQACQASLSFTISQNLLKLMSIDSMMPSNHLFLCLSSYSLLTNVTDCLLQRFVYSLILSQLCQDDFSKTQILRYHSLATKIFGYYELTIVYW